MNSAAQVAVTETATGVRFDIRVIPRARRTEITQVREGRLLVRVTAPPVGRAANEAVARALADALQVQTRSVRIVLGETSRNKTVEIAGTTADIVRRQLDHLTMA